MFPGKIGALEAGREARGGEKKRSEKRECAPRGSRTKWQRSERTDQFDVQSETEVPVGAKEPGPGPLQFSRGLLAEVVGGCEERVWFKIRTFWIWRRTEGKLR